jgi:hypothetical protein
MATTNTKKRKRTVKVQYMETQWKEVLERELVKVARKLARERLKAGRGAGVTADRILVRVPVSITVGFAREGNKFLGPDHAVEICCTCIRTQPGVEVCYGNCCH